MRALGVHLGLGEGDAKALAHAKRLGCTAVQVFTHSPRSFQFKPLDEARLSALRAGWSEVGIGVVVSHCCYLINLGSSDSKAFHGSLAVVRKELEYAAAFGCAYFVLHVGKYTTTDHETGMRQVAKGLNRLADTLSKTGVTLLLETVAGQGTEIGDTFEGLAQLLSMLDPPVREHVGVCVDTCHIFAAGYDIRTPKGAEEVVRKMDAAFGVAAVKVIHVNDSKGDLASRLDRHENLGKGNIGLDGLRAFVTHPKLKDLPLILETPFEKPEEQATDMGILRRLVTEKSF